MQEITPEAAFVEIQSGRAVGVDVRELNEWTAGHAENVLWNPVSEFDVAALPADTPLIFICRSGARSGKVASELEARSQGAFNMVGGMKAWHTSGLAMVCDSGIPEVA